MKLRKEFAEALTNYKINKETQGILQKTPLVLLVGMSASGRDTMVKELLKLGDYYGVVTHTTRQPRLNEGIKEQDGVDYFFRKEEEVLQMIKEGELVAVGLLHNQQISGVNIHELAKAHSLNKIALTDIDVAGAKEFVKIKPDTKCIFTLPPSIEVWLERLKKRGEPDKEEFMRRLQSAEKELTQALNSSYYHYVVNDDLKAVVKEIDEMVHGHTDHAKEDETGRALAAQLLQDVKELLA